MGSNEQQIDPGLIAHSYTGAFAIRKRIRKLNDLRIPARNGISEEQFVAFFIGLIAMVTIWPFINSIILGGLLGVQISGKINLLLMLLIPFLLSRQIGKPMPTSKTIPGWLGSMWRSTLDDRYHLRGMPLPAPRTTEPELLLYRTWEPDPEYQGYYTTDPDGTYLYLPEVAATPAEEIADAAYATAPVDLEVYLADRAAAANDRQAAAAVEAEAADLHTVYAGAPVAGVQAPSAGPGTGGG